MCSSPLPNHKGLMAPEVAVVSHDTWIMKEWWKKE
jgi:hypothetical protein